MKLPLFRLAVTLLAFNFNLYPCESQITKPNKYGARVIDDIEQYKKTVKAYPYKSMVDLGSFIPNIVIDLKYAADKNLMRKPLYKDKTAYVRFPVALKLWQVQEELEELGYGLKVWDAYRPYFVTVEMYQKLNKNFVAHPKYGSIHNRGCAVDITIIDLATGKELEMPTSHDQFSFRASHKCNYIPPKTVKNRELLRNIMIKHSFVPLEHEWWHYDFKLWRKYELLNLSFEELRESE